MNQISHFGVHAIVQLSEILKELAPNSIFLITGKNSYKSSGAQTLIKKLLNGYRYYKFNDFEENPRIEDVENGIALFKKYNCDLIIAIGGGSVIDMAKLINCFQANKNYLGIALNNEEIKHKGKKLIAIPTTSGSGSEATHFAVLYINKGKYSIENHSILPDIAIVDPQLTYSLSPYRTAVTGLDAFSHAVESHWSINSTSESLSFAEEAIGLIWKHLPKAVGFSATDSRNILSYASNLAGKVINITRTTAPHALSYALTSRYNIPHGHAVSLFLPLFFEYNYNVNSNNCIDTRGYKYVQNKIEVICELLGIKSKKEMQQNIHNFIYSLGVENNFERLNLTPNDITFIIDNVNLKRVRNNPRILEKDKLMKLIYG